MLKKLFYLILSVGILTFMLPNNLQAQSNVLNLQYTIYSQNPDIPVSYTHLTLPTNREV